MQGDAVNIRRIAQNLILNALKYTGRGGVRTAQAPGEGIGFAIVKRLCELLDATLELETEFGRGSVFRVVLPRYYDAD